MKKVLCFFAVLGVVVLTNAVSALPVANAAYWCDAHRVCHERNSDCPYWQDNEQGSRYGHHHRGYHCP